jgi:glucokinase
VDATAHQIAEAVRKAIEAGDVDIDRVLGIGMAVPGHVRPRDGVVLYSPNFADGWRNVQLARPVSDETGLPTFIGNDANLAALGEYKYGAGQDFRHLVMFTLGTGIGGGVVIDGRLLTGSAGGAGELGHVIIAASEGARAGNSRFGSLEGLAQASAIVERAHRKIATGCKTLLNANDAFDWQALTPKAIADAAAAGDEVAIETMEETGYYVGLGVASCINIFNPEVFVIGGGIAQAGDLLMEPIRRTARANAFGSLYGFCRIVVAELGDNAGIMGGAALVQHEMSG